MFETHQSRPMEFTTGLKTNRLEGREGEGRGGEGKGGEGREEKGNGAVRRLV
jgi:hypothetical protein